MKKSLPTPERLNSSAPISSLPGSVPGSLLDSLNPLRADLVSDLKDPGRNPYCSAFFSGARKQP